MACPELQVGVEEPLVSEARVVDCDSLFYFFPNQMIIKLPSFQR